MNAVLAGVERCLAKASGGPDQSLLWQTWRELSWDRLFPGDLSCQEYLDRHRGVRGDCTDRGALAYTANDGLLTTHAFIAVEERLRKLLSTATSETCLTPIALTLTSARQNPVTIVDPYEVRSSRVQVNVAVRSVCADEQCRTKRIAFCHDERKKKEGQSPAALQLPFTEREGSFVRTPPLEGARSGCQELATQPLFDAVIAGASVLGGFLPRDVLHCASNCDSVEVPGLFCPAGKKLCRSQYLDGGLFDTQPLAAAIGGSDELLLPDPVPPEAEKGPLVVSSEFRLGAASPSRDPKEAERVAGALGYRGTAYYQRFAANFLEVAGDYELQMLARFDRLNEIKVVKRTLPLVSDIPLFSANEPLGLPLSPLTPMLDGTFRLYDFYIGVVEGMHYLAEGKEDEFLRLARELEISRAPGLEYLALTSLLQREIVPTTCKLKQHAASQEVHDRLNAVQAAFNAAYEEWQKGRPRVWRNGQREPAGPDTQRHYQLRQRDASFDHELRIRRIWRSVHAVNAAECEYLRQFSGRRLPGAEPPKPLDHYGVFVAALQRPTAKQIMEDAESAKSLLSVSAYGQLTEAAQLRYAGQPEDEARYDFDDSLDYISSYRPWRYSVIRDAMARMEALEREDRSGLAGVFALAGYTGAIGESQWHQGWSVGASSIPSRVLRHQGLAIAQKLVLPSYAAFSRGWHDWGADLRWDVVRLSVGTQSTRYHWQLGFDAHAFLRANAVEEDQAWWDRFVVGPSLAFSVSSPTWWLPELGLRSTWWWGPARPFGDTWKVGAEVFGRPVWSRLHMGVGVLDVTAFSRKKLDTAAYITVGVADLNGLIYWGLRGITGDNEAYGKILPTAMGAIPAP